MGRRNLVAGGILMLALGTAGAADPADCPAIAEPSARLACYDRLHPPAAVSAAPAPATLPPETERFGAEALPAGEAAPDAIESRISGSFKGWRRNSEFQLDNGQVWRCVNCREVYYVAENPAVTVKRGFTSNYWLQVEGLNTRASVKRIK